VLLISKWVSLYRKEVNSKGKCIFIFFPFIQLVTLRGSILEDSVATTGKHGTVRGLSLKEVLEQVVPELNISCLRLALSTPKVTEQLLKLDEQGVGYVSVLATDC